MTRVLNDIPVHYQTFAKDSPATFDAAVVGESKCVDAFMRELNAYVPRKQRRDEGNERRALVTDAIQNALSMIDDEVEGFLFAHVVVTNPNDGQPASLGLVAIEAGLTPVDAMIARLELHPIEEMTPRLQDAGLYQSDNERCCMFWITHENDLTLRIIRNPAELERAARRSVMARAVATTREIEDRVTRGESLKRRFDERARDAADEENVQKIADILAARDSLAASVAKAKDLYRRAGKYASRAETLMTISKVAGIAASGLKLSKEIGKLSSNDKVSKIKSGKVALTNLEVEIARRDLQYATADAIADKSLA